MAGLSCPICEGDTKVKDSRKHVSGIYRRRVCDDCDYRFSTMEAPHIEGHHYRTIVRHEVAERLRTMAKDIDH